MKQVNKAPIRFLRSTHLERDFYDPKALDSYVLTDVVVDCVQRISDGLRVDSSQRSWRIIGDYGSGKSSFALLLAHWFSGNIKTFSKKLSTSLNYSNFGVSPPQFIPVLATGSREPLAKIIQKGIKNSLQRVYSSGFDKRAKKIQFLLNLEEISDAEILSLINLVNKKISTDQKGHGLLIIIDELGKSLEFAAETTNTSDVYLMQQLAEEASRSGELPFFIVGILHQGFGAYAASLGLTAKKEWEKVAGRYDEIVFQHPMEQSTALIAEALSTYKQDLNSHEKKKITESMRLAHHLGWYGVASNLDILLTFAPRISPVDPSVLPLLHRVLHRFGQNQRSVFSFLFGNEASALQAFHLTNQNGLYRVYNLYDYIHSNLGHHLATTFSTTHWTVIDSMVSSFVTDNPLHLQIIKTVGVFNLLNNNDLRPTPEAISLCITGRLNDSKVLKEIEWLQTDKGKRVLFDRGISSGLCLWPHISVDLQKAQEDAESVIGSITSPTDFIRTHLENTNLVARRHYIQTGTLRHFPVIFCKPSDLKKPTELIEEQKDGFALTPLCLNKADVDEAIKNARSSVFKENSNYLVIIPGKLQGLAPLIREVQVWDWISQNTPELNGDRYARETVSRKRTLAQKALEDAINKSVGFEHLESTFSLQCYWNGRKLNISSGKELVSKLSDICDELYRKAPSINNELINRQNISAAAAGARMRLIEGVLERPNQPFLGMDASKTPPEMSMYLSVLKMGELHIETENGAKLELSKKDPLKLVPVFDYLKDRLKSKMDELVSIDLLLNELAQKPYGIRKGLAPLLLAIFYTINKRNIACYEKGTFLSELTGAEFLRLTKRPDLFEFQYCNLDGLRSNAFERLSTILHIKKSSQKPELLDIIRPLFVLIGNLPPYTKKTTNLTPATKAVRDALMDARNPLTLLFDVLPKSCGCKPVTPEGTDQANAKKFTRILEASIHELQGAYKGLLERIGNDLMKGFGYKKMEIEKFRTEISARAKTLFPYVTEKELKAFCYRLQEVNQPLDHWLNSVASVVVYKPAEKWIDQDEDKYKQLVFELTTRFSRTEGFSFNKNSKNNTQSVRLCVTKPNGEEKAQVLLATSVDDKEIQEVEKQMQNLIKEHGELALLAASRVLWDNLKG